MPLLFVKDVAPNVKLGVWSIKENVDEFFFGNACLEAMRDEISLLKSYQRRCEVLAVRLLLDKMLGYDVVLSHNSDGKPILNNGMNIGVSHTKGCAAVILSPCNNVSVDVEYLNDRVERIVGKFLRPDEKAETLLEKLLHWCAKETLYKIYSADHLALADMWVLSVEGDNANGFVVIKNVQRGETLNVDYRVFDNLVLTYAVL